MNKNYSPFKTCVNGHDLTVEDAYLYDGRGTRVCRACATQNKKSKQSKRGTFA